MQFGDTALHYASYCGHADLVGLLLDAGADALRVSADGRTALSTAIEEGHGAVVRLLVDALPQGDDAVGAAADGVRAARVDARATAALTAAATSEPSQSAGVAPTRRPSVGGALSLRSGAAAGSLGGASASAALLPLQQLQQSAPLSHALGVVLLCDAVQAGNLRAVCGLLGGGTGGGASVDVNGVDADGFTALHRAAVTGAVHLVDALLGHGADPNARDAVRRRWGGPLLELRGQSHVLSPHVFWRRRGARRCTTRRASVSQASCTCSSQRGATRLGATARG